MGAGGGTAGECSEAQRLGEAMRCDATAICEVSAVLMGLRAGGRAGALPLSRRSAAR